MRPPAGQMTPLSMRQYSRNLQPPAVHLMHEPRRLEKHQWAGSVHHVDPVLATKSNGIRRNRTGPAGPFVKPDPAHSRCDRVLYQTDAGAWRSNDEEASTVLGRSIKLVKQGIPSNSLSVGFSGTTSYPLCFNSRNRTLPNL